jgi:hypothetical protein
MYHRASSPDRYGLLALVLAICLTGAAVSVGSCRHASIVGKLATIECSDEGGSGQNRDASISRMPLEMALRDSPHARRTRLTPP